MVDFKLVINDPKTGKSYAKDVKDEAADFLLGKRIGDKVDGKHMQLAGYEFEVTGGSDYCGFPMRKDVDTSRKKILAVEGVGMKRTAWGIRHRKTVAGSKVHAKISQINLKILKHGKQKLGEESEQAGTEAKPEQDAGSQEKAKVPEKEETKKEQKEEKEQIKQENTEEKKEPAEQKEEKNTKKPENKESKESE